MICNKEVWIYTFLILISDLTFIPVIILSKKTGHLVWNHIEFYTFFTDLISFSSETISFVRFIFRSFFDINSLLALPL